MARLVIAQTAAPDFSNAASLLKQSGQALDGAFNTASGVLSRYKQGREEVADGEIVKRIAELNDEADIDKFLTSSEVQDAPLSANMQDRLLKLRGQLLGYASDRASVKNTESSTNARDSATRIAENRAPLGLELLRGQVQQIDGNNQSDAVEREYQRRQIEADLTGKQANTDKVLAGTEGVNIDNETRGARNTAALALTEAQTGLTSSNAGLVDSRIIGQNTKNASDELTLAAQPAAIERDARAQESSIRGQNLSNTGVGLRNDNQSLINGALPGKLDDENIARDLANSGTRTTNQSLEIERKADDLRLANLPNEINQGNLQAGANLASTRSSTDSNIASRNRLNAQDRRAQATYEDAALDRQRLQVIAPEFGRVYNDARQNGSKANIQRLIDVMNQAGMSPDEMTKQLDSLQDVANQADSRNTASAAASSSEQIARAVVNSLSDPTITSSGGATRDVISTPGLSATQALSAAQTTSKLGSGSLDVVVSPDVEVDPSIVATLEAAERRREDRDKSDPVVRRFKEAGNIRKRLDNGEDFSEILSPIFNIDSPEELYDMSNYINDISDKENIPPEYVAIELLEESQSKGTIQGIKDVIYGFVTGNTESQSTRRVVDNAKKNFSSKKRDAYQEQQINENRIRQEASLAQKQLNDVRSSIKKYGKGNVPPALIIEEKALYEKVISLSDQFAPR